MATSLFSNLPYKVADIALAKKGREEISWLEKEMPGILSIRKKYENSQPLTGLRISGTLHITTHTAVFIETLKLLGADVRWSASNIYSTQDHIAAAIAEMGIPIFAWKGEKITDYWWTLFQSLHFNNHQGPTHIIDDKGDLAMMVHKGLNGENNPSILDEKLDIPSQLELNLFLKRVLAEDQNFWKNQTQNLEHITEVSRTGSNELHKLHHFNQLLYPIFDLNTSKIKRKIDNYYSSKETVAEAIKMVARTMLVGKSVVICGFGEIGQGCAESLRLNGARVSITETDPIRALQAAMQGYQVVCMEDACKTADIFVTATGQRHIITLDHMSQMKDQTIICSMGHHELEIELDKLNQNENIKRIPISEDLIRYYFPDGHSILLVAETKLVNLSFDTPQLAFIKSCTYSLLILLHLYTNKKDLKIGFHTIPKILDHEVAQLHLDKIGAKITTK